MTEHLAQLSSRLNPARYTHSMRVMSLAMRLAERFDVDPLKARDAAIFHDCAKCLTLEQMRGAAQKAKLDLDEITLGSRALLHAPVGVLLTQQDYGIDDPQVLSAIRWHTTGRPGMSDLEKIIYLADMIEPGRKPFPMMKVIADACRHNLDQAMLLALTSTTSYITQKAQALHPATQDALQYYQTMNIH